MSETVLSFSVDSQIEHRAQITLAGVGLTVAEAVVVFLREVAENHIPLDLLKPDIKWLMPLPDDDYKLTPDALALLNDPNREYVSFDTVEELMADLHADD